MAKEAGKAVGVDVVSKFCKQKYPTPSDQERGMRAAFEALDKDGFVSFFLYFWINHRLLNFDTETELSWKLN